MNDEVKGSFKGVLVASAVVVTLMFGMSLWAWMQIAPDAKIPTHWGGDGKADGFGSRKSLFLLPSVMAGIALLFAAIPRFEPRQGHLMKSSTAYKATWYGMLGFMGILHGAMVFAALGRAVPINSIVSVGVGVLLVVIGNYLGKVRSNFFFGVRTPWTLSSELSWNKTHRLTGKIFVVWGILLGVSGVVDAAGKWMIWLSLGGAGILIGFVLVYSYVVWRGDPGRLRRR